jgi:D-alanyl-D-alanine carboxypeptidase
VKTTTSYEDRVADIWRELGIGKMNIARPPFIEATDLVSIGLDIHGREQRLSAPAAEAWHAMAKAAQSDEVILLLVSAFRSLDYQKALIQRKLDAGQTIESILQVNAAPGLSEHHTGRAVDLTTFGCEPLTEAFERTQAFEWLVRNASAFGFQMTYPRNNTSGIIYEPWHWAFKR